MADIGLFKLSGEDKNDVSLDGEGGIKDGQSAIMGKHTQYMSAGRL
jgi:hypothetical protein